MDARGRERSWAWWGMASVGLFVAGSVMPFPTVSEADQDDPERLVDALSGHEVELFIRNGLSWWAAAALLVFVVGLHRHLRAHHDPDSLVPGVALVGGVVTGAGLFVGYGLLAAIGGVVASDRPATTVAAVYAVADGLAYSLWTPLGLTCGAVAVAGFRGRGVSAWLGRVSAFFTVLFAGLAFFPFLSWFPGLLWMLAVSVGLLLGTGSAPGEPAHPGGPDTTTG